MPFIIKKMFKNINWYYIHTGLLYSGNKSL